MEGTPHPSKRAYLRAILGVPRPGVEEVHDLLRQVERRDTNLVDELCQLTASVALVATQLCEQFRPLLLSPPTNTATHTRVTVSLLPCARSLLRYSPAVGRL